MNLYEIRIIRIYELMNFTKYEKYEYTKTLSNLESLCLSGKK